MSVVPDLLRLKNIPTNLQQNVETDLLETSTFQEATRTTGGFARFDLQKKGWLHSHSKLFLSLIPKAGEPIATFPPHIGVNSVIQKAVLKIGNQTLNEIDDWNYLQVIKSCQINNETQISREQFTNGRCMASQYMYRKANAGGTNTEQSDNLAQTVGMDIHRDYNLGTAAGVGANWEGANLLPLQSNVLNPAEVSASPTYSIDLSDLFPFLKTHSLPLYMIDQQLSIELHWSPTENKRVILAGAKAGDADYLIDRNELKFCADYVFYTDSDLMLRYAEANPRIEFSFPDYRLSKSTATHTALANGIVSNLGMANRLCSRVLTILSNDAATDQSILGPYAGLAPNVDGAGNTGAISYNIRYNDRFEFASSLSNKARLFSLFTQSEGLPFVTRKQYSNDGNGGQTTLNFMNARVQSTELQGRLFSLATRLTSGRVGVRGIELHYTAGGMTNLPGGYTVRSFLEYARLAVLEGGMFSVFNA